MTRATAIRFAAMSAVLIFGLADGLALLAGIPFPPIQWAGVVVGVTVLTWWRELAQ